MIAVYCVGSAAALCMVGFFWSLRRLSATNRKVEQELENMKITRFQDPGTVRELSVMPLVEYYAENGHYKTEAGVSYLLKADNHTILLDTGANAKASHPSPLIYNMEKLGEKPDTLDSIFISHIHMDHVGGKEEERNRTFSLTKGRIDLPEIPVHSPGDLSCSHLNPGPVTEKVTGPLILQDGIASLGPIPRSLFLLGYTVEHSLAFNVEGKGIVIVIGCGHPTIEKILERAKQLYDEPIYGIIGGLHFPVNGGRMNLGPINLQKLVGSDRPPWRGLNEADVASAIRTIQKADPGFIALSPHDSSDWAIEEFRRAFGDRYHDIKVGRELKI